MFMNQLVENWQKAREQVLGKEEFISGEIQKTFLDTVKVYYFFFMLSLPLRRPNQNLICSKELLQQCRRRISTIASF